MPPPIALSKTRLLSFIQCPRKVWLEQYSPELEDEAAIDEAAIATGRAVGDAARGIYGNGHQISNDRGLRAAVSDTAALIEAGGSDPLFEATFDHAGLTVQVDVLDRSHDGVRLIEVKASTGVRDHYYDDCAIQAWTLSQCGIEPASVVLAHVNADFEYRGDGNYTGLLTEVDVSEQVAERVAQVATLVDQTRETLDSLDEPEHPIGAHCRSPHVCPFFDHCAPDQGEFPVSGLGGSRAHQYALMQAGYTDLRDVPEDELQTDTQQRIQAHTRAGVTQAEPALRSFVEDLPYPRYYIDFETVGFAVPVWAETQPYQALPFQWSCHTESAAGQVEHREFLDLSGEPPMRGFAEELIAALGTIGPVIVYSGYEKRILRALAERFADLKPALDGIVDRLTDLLPVTKANYYDPRMLGSWSIKAVLPTIAPDLDYAALGEVQDGQAAQTAYLEAIAGETTADRREEIRAALSEYCRYDTLAMVRLVEYFARI